MNLAPAGVELSFEVTFDSPSLNVGMSVYDTTDVDPVLASGPAAMTSLYGNTYFGKFTPADGHSYVIVKAVYTSDTFDTLDTDYAAGSESIYAQVIGGGGASSSAPQSVIGIVQNDPIIGVVEC